MATTALVGAHALAYLDARYRITEDLRAARGIVKARLALNRNNRNDRNSIYYVFESAADKERDRDCYVCEGVTLSWRQVQLCAAFLVPLAPRRRFFFRLRSLWETARCARTRSEPETLTRALAAPLSPLASGPLQPAQPSTAWRTGSLRRACSAATRSRCTSPTSPRTRSSGSRASPSTCCVLLSSLSPAAPERAVLTL